MLHVISQDPSTRIDVPQWCYLTGHELLRTQEDGSETLFWIKKR
jgi:TusA-related sulfurtransferase